MRMRQVTVVTALAVTAVALLLVAALAWSRPGSPSTVGEPGPGPVPGAAERSTTTGTAGAEPVGRSPARIRDAQPVTRPVRVIMDSVDIAAPVHPVGVARDGQMEIPPDPRVVGWYRFGAAPGERSAGSVVLAGHLDSKRFGLGPLVHLRDLRPGDPVEVTLTDGTTRTYRVTGLERFDRQALPAFVFSRSGPERLRVVTCGGEYDAEAGGYQENLVVSAVPDPPLPGHSTGGLR